MNCILAENEHISLEYFSFSKIFYFVMIVFSTEVSYESRNHSRNKCLCHVIHYQFSSYRFAEIWERTHYYAQDILFMSHMIAPWWKNLFWILRMSFYELFLTLRDCKTFCNSMKYSNFVEDIVSIFITHHVPTTWYFSTVLCTFLLSNIHFCTSMVLILR